MIEGGIFGFSEYDIKKNKKVGEEMFRRRRRRRGLTIGNLIGLVCCVVGIIILIYVIPFKLWIFFFGCSCVVMGAFIFRL